MDYQILCGCTEPKEQPKEIPDEQSDSSCSCMEPKQPFALLEVEIGRNILNLPQSSSEETSSSSDVVNAIILQGTIPEEEEYVSCAPEQSDSLGTCSCTICESKVIDVKPIEEDKELECTLAIIKPEALMYRKEIEREIISEGFIIRQVRWLRLTPEQASDFYLDDFQHDDFAALVAYMSSGPILVLAISKINAIKEWNNLIGPAKVSEAKVYAPDSIRGKYGRAGDDLKNVVHGSKNSTAAQREIHYFFPDHVIEPLLKGQAVVEYLWHEINETLTNGLTKCCEEQPEDPITWLGNWLLDNNTKGPTCL